MPTQAAVSRTLAATDAEIKNKFSKLLNLKSVADLLEIPDWFLRHVLYGMKERQQYAHFNISKRSGSPRLISVPPKNIRILQNKLLRVFNIIYKPKKCVTGFVKDRSVVSNASPHTRKRCMLNIDIANFFPSIHIGRIRGMFAGEPYGIGSNAALILAQIACDDAGSLPQGSPISPIIANMLCGALDSQLVALSRQHRCTYTRYADDITFSTTRGSFAPEIASVDADGKTVLGAPLLEIFAKHTFAVREEKTRLKTSLGRQRVTGIVVNEFPNLPREYMRNLRALIHSADVHGLRAAALNHATTHKRTPGAEPEQWIRNVIRGRLAYAKMVRGDGDPSYRKLVRAAQSVLGNASPRLMPLENVESHPIRRRTTRNPDWTMWADRYRDIIFRLQCHHPREQNQGAGTGFVVGRHLIVTAGHNIILQQGNGLMQRDIGRINRDESVDPMSVVCCDFDDSNCLDIGVCELPTGEIADHYIPTEERVPQIGEEIAAIGYPYVPYRMMELVMHIGRVESVASHRNGVRFISVSFTSGPGLSGSPLLDARGYCIGVMVQNTYDQQAAITNDQEVGNTNKQQVTLVRPYGQAIAFEQWRSIPNAPRRLSS